MKTVFWFEFRDHRRRVKPWRVWFVDVLSDRDESSDGMCDYRVRHREIEILASVPYARIFELLGHELIHAMCAHKTSESDADLGAEEHVAKLAQDSLLPIMASLGAKIPPFPDGFRKLRKAALERTRRAA